MHIGGHPQRAIAESHTKDGVVGTDRKEFTVATPMQRCQITLKCIRELAES